MAGKYRNVEDMMLEKDVGREARALAKKAEKKKKKMGFGSSLGGLLGGIALSVITGGAATPWMLAAASGLGSKVGGDIGLQQGGSLKGGEFLSSQRGDIESQLKKANDTAALKSAATSFIMGGGFSGDKVATGAKAAEEATKQTTADILADKGTGSMLDLVKTTNEAQVGAHAAKGLPMDIGNWITGKGGKGGLKGMFGGLLGGLGKKEYPITDSNTGLPGIGDGGPEYGPFNKSDQKSEEFSMINNDDQSLLNAIQPSTTAASSTAVNLPSLNVDNQIGGGNVDPAMSARVKKYMDSGWAPDDTIDMDVWQQIGGQ